MDEEKEVDLMNNKIRVDTGNNSENPTPSMGKRFVMELWDLCKIFVSCFVIVWLITQFLAKPIRVEGSSMYPTLVDGEIGITNVYGVKFQDVKRFDVVIIYKEDRDEFWVKRLIGMPGDTISCKDGVVYINGEPQKEEYLDQNYVSQMSKEQAFTSDFDEVTLGDDEYWCMGDNRPRSEDSRVHGPFLKKDIRGKDVMILYPFDKIKVVTN